MKFKELKKQNKELQDKLNLANSIVATLDDMCEHYEKQLKQQDKELARRLTIIRYLETKALAVEKGCEN